MRSVISLVALATLIASSTGAGPLPRPGGTPLTSQKSAFPFAFTEKVMANGLRIFVVPYDSPGLVAYYSVVRAGSRNEVEPGKSGFAHFFEHIMFRGTERYSTERYNAEIKAMGADSNAFTAEDMTVYHILAGKSALPKVVEIEADRFLNLKYDEASFQKEARAILGEYTRARRIRCRRWTRLSTTMPLRCTATSTPLLGFCVTSRTCPTSSHTRASFLTATIGPTT